MLVLASVVQASPVAATQRLLLVNVLLVLMIVAFFAAIVLALVRRSMRERVEAARLAAMGTATARILHQVKNPLQTILLHAEMLQDDLLVTDEAVRREVCEAIVGEAGRITMLLEDLSAYASGVSRRLMPQAIPVHQLVRDAVRQAEREAEREGIVVVAGPIEEVVAEADVYFLRQAVENVVRNAREALRERPDRGEARLGISLVRRGGDAVIEVRDNGPGIPTERIGQVFEPFVTSKAKGMGLGLPICREIVEGHGGRIELRSRPGSGTVVLLVLPARSARASVLQSA